MKCRILIVLLLSVLTGTSLAETFDIPLRIRYAKELYDARRYRDAEHLLEAVYLDSLPLVSEKTDNFLVILDYLARSIAQQGRTEGVLKLLEQRHALIAKHHDTRGYAFANSMSRLAEALYREGSRQQALSFSDHALELYKNLKPVPDKAIELVSNSRLQYKVSEFSNDMLPMDLSDFYTRCEHLNDKPGAAVSDALINTAMSQYVEVGVDYKPTGLWSDYYDIMALKQQKEWGDKTEIRLFIPRQHEPMRNELCMVASMGQPLIHAESILEH